MAMVPIGDHITTTSPAVDLSTARAMLTIIGGPIPASADALVIQADGDELRYTYDGTTTPSATVGLFLASGEDVIIELNKVDYENLTFFSTTGELQAQFLKQ